MPPRSPQTAGGQALKERAEAVRDERLQTLTAKSKLISVHEKLMVALQSPIEARDSYGKPYIAQRGKMLKFNGYICSELTDGTPLTDPEVQELIESHPAFVGASNQPKMMAWEGDPLVPWNRQMPIQTIQGAIGAGPKPVQPPHPEWDSLEPDQIRELLNLGVINVQRAVVWEAQHRRRPAIIVDLGEAMGRGQVGPDVVADESGVMAMAAPPESFGPPPLGGN